MSATHVWRSFGSGAPMAWYPQDAAIQGFANLTEVRAWTGLAEPVWLAIQVRLGDMDNNIRNLSLISAAGIRAANRAAQVPVPGAGAPLRQPTPLEAAQAGMMWRIAKKRAFMEAGQPIADYIDVDPNLGTTAGTGAAVAAPVTPQRRKFKMSLVIDQADETEVQTVDKAQYDTWVQNYVTATGSPPEDDVDPSEDQLTAIHTRAAAPPAGLGLTPYTDFAVFGPYGRKMLRAAKFRAWIPNGNGTYSQREFSGPATFLQWMASWRVFAVAMRMLTLASEGALEAYRMCIEKLVVQWGDAWHLIVVADDKMRYVQLERIRKRIVADIARGVPIGTFHEWDANNPWSGALRQAAKDRDYWNEQVRDPAAAWVARGGRGAPKAPDELLAGQLLPGGEAAIHPEADGRGKPTPRKERRERPRAGEGAARKKTKIAKLQEELAVYREKPPGKGDRRGGGTGRGKGGRLAIANSASADDPCNNWNRGFGDCSKLAPGSDCANGRKHCCSKCGGAHRVADCKKSD